MIFTYYFSKDQKSRIIHTAACHHIRGTDIRRLGWFDSLYGAYKRGFRPCRHCSILAGSFRRGRGDIDEFSKKNRLLVFFNDKEVSVISPYSKWKITPTEEGDRLALYHRNLFEGEGAAKSEIAGYHRQDGAFRDSVLGYLEYVVRHDSFRRENPVIIPKQRKPAPPPPRKGTKRYNKQVMKQKRRERRLAIKNVLSLIDSLGTDRALAQA